MKNFAIILTIIIFIACGNSNTSNSIVITDSVTLKTDTTLLDSVNTKKPAVETINFTDANGLKQGKWVKKWKGKIVNVAHYKDNLLHGYSAYYLNGNVLTYDGNYVNGKREGLFLGYYSFKYKSICWEGFFKNDTCIWSGFPACDKDRLVPLKGFGINRDAVFIQDPDYDGKIWYEGNFKLQKNKYNDRKETEAYGIHKVYFKNGKLKGIVDYDKQTIQEFDTNGTRHYKAKFNEFEVHKQTMRVY
ncbi:MAG: hypothetical protein ACEQSR_12130 [Candidatus Methylacidiphilales bacterium]